MTKLLFRICAVFVLMMTLILSSSSEEQDIEKKGPCRTDYERFCKNIKPGKGRIAACLKSHESELSQSCKNHIEDVKEKSAEFRKSCRDDVKKYCNGVRTGGGRVLSCLKSNRNSLSDPCKAFFPEKK